MSVDFCDKSHQSEHAKYDAAWRWVHGHVRHIVVKSRMCIAYGRLVCSIIINNRLSAGIAWFIDRNDRLTHTKLQCLLFRCVCELLRCLAGPGNFRPNFCVCSLSPPVNGTVQENGDNAAAAAAAQHENGNWKQKLQSVIQSVCTKLWKYASEQKASPGQQRHVSSSLSECGRGEAKVHVEMKFAFTIIIASAPVCIVCMCG